MYKYDKAKKEHLWLFSKNMYNYDEEKKIASWRYLRETASFIHNSVYHKEQSHIFKLLYCFQLLIGYVSIQQKVEFISSDVVPK